MDFVTRKEDYNEYQLADGKILKMKNVLTDVYRIDTEKDPEGNPVYQVKAQIIARVK